MRRERLLFFLPLFKRGEAVIVLADNNKVLQASFDISFSFFFQQPTKKKNSKPTQQHPQVQKVC